MSARGNDPEQRRRIRRALLGRGELTREDAEVVQHGRERLGWVGRHLVALLLVSSGVSAVLIAIGLVIRDQLAVSPTAFLVLSVVAIPKEIRNQRKIELALRHDDT